MSLQIFEQILTRTMSAPVFHSDQRNLHLFLSFPGFAALHEYQFFDESITFNRVKKYVIDNYERLPPDDAPEQFNLFFDLIGERKRTEMEGDRRWNALKESWARYVQWETESRDLYESKAKELFDAGLVTDAKFVQDLAAGVSEELAMVKDIYLALSGMDFDLPTITSMQIDLKERKERELRRLFHKTKRTESG